MIDPIDPRFLEARRRALRYKHPHLDYPAYVRRGRASHVHTLADDDTLPIAGAPIDLEPPHDWRDGLLLTAVALVAVALLFIGPGGA